jgi:general secretion pathway protein I
MKSSLPERRLRQTRSRRRRSCAGFSLLEVVIAVVLVGVVFGAIIQAFSYSLRNINQVNVYHTALQLAQNKMNELLIDETVIGDGLLEGSWDANYSWRAQMETREVDDLTIDKNRLSTRLLHIRLTVVYASDGRRREVRLFTIKLVPKPDIGEPGRLSGRRSPYAR